jgi:hypothetical protein
MTARIRDKIDVIVRSLVTGRFNGDRLGSAV